MSANGVGGEFSAVAELLLRADYLLISAGAGFSADSGLSVYKDIANVPAWRARGLSYHDLCEPSWLSRDPATFYGFWGSCFNSYMETEPHAGYAAVRRWREEVVGVGTLHALRARQSSRPASAAKSIRPASAASAGRGVSSRQSESPGVSAMPARRHSLALPSHVGTGAPALAPGSPAQLARTFVFTSNVDCAFARAGLGGDDTLWEIHGNLRTWQCARPCHGSRAAPEGPTWALGDAHRFEVNPVTMLASPHRAPATPPEPEAADEDRAPPTADPAAALPADQSGAAEDGSAPRATPRATVDLRTVTPPLGEPNYPRCPHCNGLARPAVLMFGDDRCVETDGGRYREWEARVTAALKKDPAKRLVIIEGGAGVRVPTVRENSERLLKKLAPHGATLVRINLDYPEVRASLARSSISLRSQCLPALETIDHAMRVRLSQAASRAGVTSALAPQSRDASDGPVPRDVREQRASCCPEASVLGPAPPLVTDAVPA